MRLVGHFGVRWFVLVCFELVKFESVCSGNSDNSIIGADDASRRKFLHRSQSDAGMSTRIHSDSVREC